jgi:hypothetical protein
MKRMSSAKLYTLTPWLDSTDRVLSFGPVEPAERASEQAKPLQHHYFFLLFLLWDALTKKKPRVTALL